MNNDYREQRMVLKKSSEDGAGNSYYFIFCRLTRQKCTSATFKLPDKSASNNSNILDL